MPPKASEHASNNATNSKKRKEAPSSSQNSAKLEKLRAKRLRTLTARTVVTQSSDSALRDGELDLQAFLKSREFEIRALESCMREAKGDRNSRAFQQVPRDMRRRTASHNVKRVPKRLRNTAIREQKQDNTPTVTSSKRKPAGARGRLRAESAKRLGVLAAKKRASKTASNGEGVARIPRPKIRRNILNEPPNPASKFKKRQIDKTWLPTHEWHAKRATMTTPKNPLWRFAIPLTSTEKSYRPSHRASHAIGAVACDMSYMSTISLEGYYEGLETVLRYLGVNESKLWEDNGSKWRSGKRAWNGWLSKEVERHRLEIGPSTIVWSSEDTTNPSDSEKSKKQPSRSLLIRIHPSMFLETWNEVLRLSKLQKPAVHVIDLRFEIGSIQITGPGSTEALLGVLHPYTDVVDQSQDGHAHAFMSLTGVTNPGSLPTNALLLFSVRDPRLQLPPRKASLPGTTNEEASFELLEMLSTWPADESTPSPDLFNRSARHQATQLPSQKSIDRRKTLASPGSPIPLLDRDPKIPILLLAGKSPLKTSGQGSWTLLAPWKCILPIWRGLMHYMHYPLPSGGNLRFGGLQEIRQVHFEQGVPWFPADFPGTQAGFAWETKERESRKAHWDKRPKGKRIEWTSLDLGAKRKGEIGLGWACDFQKLLEGFTATEEDIPPANTDSATTATISTDKNPVSLLPTAAFTSLLLSSNITLPPANAIITVRLTFVGKGVASPCARIYRLPTQNGSSDSLLPSDTKEKWLSLLSATSSSSGSKTSSKKLTGRLPLNKALPKSVRLAQSLLQPPVSLEDYPLVPDEHDLIGFVTTGEFNLAAARGVCIGSVVAKKLLEGLRASGPGPGKKTFIVRNAGEALGRLARWEII